MAVLSVFSQKKGLNPLGVKLVEVPYAKIWKGQTFLGLKF